MHTRSETKKNFTTEFEVTTPSVTKGRRRSTVEAEIHTPITVHNDKTDLKNVQLPVFNIHIHVPQVTCYSNKSYQFQPAIHVHVDQLAHNLPFGATAGSVKKVDKTTDVESPSGVNYNFYKQSNSLTNKLSKPHKKSKMCKKLNFSDSEEYSANLEAEKSEAVLNPIANIEENEDSSRNPFYEKQLPTRRSIRQANNRKLLQSLKDLNGKEVSVTKTKREKSYRNIEIENKSGSLGQTLNLKEPMVVLYDICKEIDNKNFTFCDTKIGKEQEDCFSRIKMSHVEIDYREKVEKLSYASFCESEQNSGSTENIEKNLEKIPNDENLIPVNEKFGEIFSLTCSSSENKTNSASNEVNDFADNCTFSDNLEINLLNTTEPENESCFYKTPCNMENNFAKDTEKSPINDSAFLQLEKQKITEQVENYESNILSNDKDVSLSLKGKDDNDDTRVSLNSKPKNSIGCSDDEFSSDDSGSNFPQTTNFDEGIHQSTSLGDMERLNVCPESENNLLQNIIEEDKLPSTESDDCKEIDVNTLGFQLKLIKKEMKKRNMVVKKELVRKRSLKKDTVSQTTGKVSEESTLARKMKVLKKQCNEKNKNNEKTKSKTMPAANKTKKSSLPEDYIPLQVSGPTKFVMADLSKVKPFSGHKARNFKKEMLFGKRVKRYSDPKQLQIYLLKKQAAKMRKK